METLLVFSQDSKRTFGIQRHRIFCLIFEQFCDKFVFFKTRKDGKIPHDHRNTYPANGGRNRHRSRPPSPKSSRSSARRVLAKSSGPHRQILRMVPTRGPGADVFDLCEHLRVRRARQPPRVRSRLFDVEPSRNRGFGELNCAAVLKNLYKSSPIGPNPLFSSCFIEAGFVPLRRAEPEPSSPQADTVELTAFAFAMV